MKRITIPVTSTIDLIRERLQDDTGVKLTYVQVVSFLINFYTQNRKDSEPRTQWRHN